jgi:hypothetical protein
MLDKKKVIWKEIEREIIHQNDDKTKTVEINVIDPSNRTNIETDTSKPPIYIDTLEIDNKTGEYFWVSGLGIEPHSTFRKSSNNKYVFDKDDVEYN